MGGNVVLEEGKEKARSSLNDNLISSDSKWQEV